MTTSDSSPQQDSPKMTVLITGTGQRADHLADILRSGGHEVIVVEPAAFAGGGTAGNDLPEELDAYVQLPITVALRADNLVGRVRSFLADGLLTRFHLVERILPCLAAHGAVALVTGNIAAGSPLPDDQRSRLALLRVLAHATRAELAERQVRVQVIPGDRGDDAILSFLRGGRQQPGPLGLDDDGSPSGKEYQDWRTEVMGLMHPIPV
jgi:hypothetical protein